MKEKVGFRNTGLGMIGYQSSNVITIYVPDPLSPSVRERDILTLPLRWEGYSDEEKEYLP